MNKELKGETKPQSTNRRKKRAYNDLDQAVKAADIALIGANGFLLKTRRKDVAIGATSVYEVNRLIGKQEEGLKEIE